MRKLKHATETAPRDPLPDGPLSLTAGRKDLLGAIKRVASLAPRRPTLPILSCLLITGSRDGTTIAATDLDHTALHFAPAWRVHARGSIAVNAKALGDILRKLPDGEVTLTVVDNLVRLTCGALWVSIAATHARDILTDDEDVICKLATAIRENKATVAYKAARAERIAYKAERAAQAERAERALRIPNAKRYRVR